MAKSPDDELSVEGGEQKPDKLSPAYDSQGGSSLSEIYNAYLPELTRYVRAKFGEGPPEPEDVAQDAFAKFATAFETQLIRNPRAFLYASVRNLVIDHKRRQRTRNAHAEEILATGEKENFDGMSPERVLIEKERFEIMRAAIETMPEEDRRVLLMHRLRARTYADIARELQMSESGVRRAVARAVAHIDTAMKARGA